MSAVMMSGSGKARAFFQRIVFEPKEVEVELESPASPAACVTGRVHGKTHSNVKSLDDPILYSRGSGHA
jgi:hypothetical protein